MMHAIKTFAAVAALVAAGLGQAQAGDNWTMNVHNDTKNAIWITVYGNGFNEDKKDWFCVQPGAYGTSNKANGYRYTNVYVRAEVKSSTNSCGDHKNKYDLNSTILTLNNQGRAMISYSAARPGDRPSVNNTAWR